MNLFSDSTYKKHFTFYSKAKHYGQKEKEKKKKKLALRHFTTNKETKLNI